MFRSISELPFKVKLIKTCVKSLFLNLYVIIKITLHHKKERNFLSTCNTSAKTDASTELCPFSVVLHTEYIFFDILLSVYMFYFYLPPNIFCCN